MAERKRREVGRESVALERLTVEYVPVGSLKPNPYNPNRQDEHDFELLCKSIEEDGFTQPVIVNKDSVIVDGEHRWRAAQAIGMDQIPVVVVDMNEAQMRISTLRHNRARGDEDIQLSAALVRDLVRLGAGDWVAESLMIDQAGLDKLLEEIDAPEVQLDEDVDMTSEEAADLTRKKEAELKQAKAGEERGMATEDGRQVRMFFSYTPEQASLVRSALGSRPAERLFELCGQVERGERSL